MAGMFKFCRLSKRTLGASIVRHFLLFTLGGLVAQAQGIGYWHTRGSEIVDARGSSVRVAGINWFGFETRDEVAHGLWTQDYHRILHRIKEQGFNTLRLPFSNQMVESSITPMPDEAAESVRPTSIDLVGLNSLEIMDRVIAAAGAEGLRVILDNQRSEDGDGNEANGLWYTRAYPERQWIADWQMLTRRYARLTDANGDPVVIGMDLRNEPYSLTGAAGGACWTGDSAMGGCPVRSKAHNWPAAAERAGNAIHLLNPGLLIFVEGVDCYDASCGWQGGNLQGAARYPVRLALSGKLVYSAHDFGPRSYSQTWFGRTTTPAQLEAIWTRMWAYLSIDEIAPVWLGAFATTNESGDIESGVPGSQGQWFSSLIDFLHKQPHIHWAYWTVNSEVESGLLGDNYAAAPANRMKQKALASIQFPLREVLYGLPATVALEHSREDGDGPLAGAFACIAMTVAGLAVYRPERKRRARAGKPRAEKQCPEKPGDEKLSHLPRIPMQVKAAAAAVGAKVPEILCQSCTSCGAKVQFT